MRLIASIALIVFSALAQAPARPSFEVATIKLNPNCGERKGRGGGMSAFGYSTSCVPLRTLIRVAYGLPGYSPNNPRQIEVLGGPAWLDSDVYDIAGKGGAGGSPERLKVMLQTLLEERCKLKAHKESKEVPMYALTVAKGGPKIRTTTSGSCRDNVVGNLAPTPAPASDGQMVLPCGWTSTMRNGALTVKTGLGVTMDQFAIGMLATLDRPIVNRTGLTGLFDVHLSYASDGSVSTEGVADSSVGVAPVPDGPSVFSAVENQLGLKLLPDKGSVDVLVIDSVERPSEN